MTIVNDLVHPDHSRRRYRLKRVRAATSALIDEYIAVAASTGPITITLPVAPSRGSCVAVGDDDGGAATNAITIEAAATIDGEESINLSTANEQAEFIFDGAMYRRLASKRLVALASGDLEVIQLAELRRALAASSDVQRIQDPARIAASADVSTWLAVNVTSGLRWVNQRDLVLVGVDVFVKMSAQRNLKITVWRPDASVLVSKTFNAVAANAGLVRFMFDAPQAIPAQPCLVGAGWTVGVYETSGTECCAWQTIQVATAVIDNHRTHLIRRDVYSSSLWYQVGDACPVVQETPASHYGICPTFADDETPDGITIIQ